MKCLCLSLHRYLEMNVFLAAWRVESCMENVSLQDKCCLCLSLPWVSFGHCLCFFLAWVCMVRLCLAESCMESCLYMSLHDESVALACLACLHGKCLSIGLSSYGLGFTWKWFVMHAKWVVFFVLKNEDAERLKVGNKKKQVL